MTRPTMNELYLPILDAAQRVGTTVSHLINLGSTKRLPIYIRPLGRTVQAMVGFERYETPYRLDGLLKLTHTDLAKFETGTEFIFVDYFDGCHHITPPIEGPRAKDDPPRPNDSEKSYVLEGDPIPLKRDDLIVMTLDLEPLKTASFDIMAPSCTWPWGTHETKLLQALARAADKFWKRYDPSDPTTAPTNETVSEWLQSQEGVASRTAEIMAQILRADGLRPGPRK